MRDCSAQRMRVVAVIGGGPAGLMAAEVLAEAGLSVDVFDAMPSVGRKFLLAGVGGMNITHAEPKPAFVARYRQRSAEIGALLDTFDSDALRAWIHGLGIETFVGTSGRVFPTDMKAAPLLRAWLKRLREAGVRLHTRHRWLGWDAEGALRLATPDGERTFHADAVILALGGGSWAKLGSDGAWVPLLAQQGVAVAPLQPSNCGFVGTGWSDFFREKCAGAPVKPVAVRLAAEETGRQGEFVITADGVEGSLIYALSADIRETINQTGKALIYLDLVPHKSLEAVEKALHKPRGSRSMSKHLASTLGVDGVRAALLRELTDADTFRDMPRLARCLKALPLPLIRPRPLEEAISSAGGVCFSALTEQLMLKQRPGVFCAGEMLDWEAPTGGYLLTACFASGRKAAEGVRAWVQETV